MSAARPELEDILGYRFERQDLLIRALTHRSSVHEKNPGGATADNEQLEFLGDSILGFIVSDMLLESHPDFPEGRLSKLKAHLVSSLHLHEVALKIGLGSHLRLGRGEELSGGREKKALLANAIEALIAAMYLDGGMGSARGFVTRHIAADADMAVVDTGLNDYKSALQEKAQALKLPQPRYAIVEERGPEHAKTFLVEARVGRDWTSRGEGFSKKSASQRAAQDVLRQMNDVK
jgi:ribonuclease-3